MDEEEFFKNFFLNFIFRAEQIKKKKVSIDEIFLQINMENLENFTDTRMYEQFIDFTNEHKNDDGIVSTDIVEYVVILNVKKIGRVINVVHFLKVSAKVVRYLKIKVDTHRLLDNMQNDIIGFANYAPISARGLRMDIFRKELKGVSITDVDFYLKNMVKAGLLKKKGVSDQYVS